MTIMTPQANTLFVGEINLIYRSHNTLIIHLCDTL